MPASMVSRADLRDDLRCAVGNLRACRETMLRERGWRLRDADAAARYGIAERHAQWLAGWIRDNWARRNA